MYFVNKVDDNKVYMQIIADQYSEKMPNGKPWPKISIVTPNYNYGNYLEETIISVLSQGYPNLEYIIVDGGSKDDSVEIIKKYENYLSYWVSEPDNGHYDSLNKGFAKATGEIFAWIIGWDLVLEYTIGSSTVAVGWTHYLVNFFETFVIAAVNALRLSPQL